MSRREAFLVRVHFTAAREIGRGARNNGQGAHMTSANGLGAERAAGGVALWIIDMISCWSFPDAEKLLPGGDCAKHCRTQGAVRARVRSVAAFDPDAGLKNSWDRTT